MRTKHWSLTLLSCSLLLGAAAHGAALTAATWTGSFQGTPYTLVANSSGLRATGDTSNTEVSFGAIVNHRLTSLDTTGLAPLFLSQTLGGSQTYNPTSGANQGIAGRFRIFIGLDNDGALLFSVPLSIGVAGNFQGTAVVPGLGIPVSVSATYLPWTTGSHVVTGLTQSGVALPDQTFSGTNSLFDRGLGSITLVAPSVVRVCAGVIFGEFPCTPGGASNQFSYRAASATSLTLTAPFLFTGRPPLPPLPEPGTVLLIGAAIVGLAARRSSAG